MKKILLLTVITLFVSLGSQAQVVVKVRPVAPVVVRPASPSTYHVWVGGSWKWNRRTKSYDWINGYWAKPRRHGSVWIEGHWRSARGGWKYVPGHWS